MDYKQISALIIWLAFYTAYITKMILLRRQGIKGSILGKNAFEVGLLIVTYGGAGVQIFSILFPSAVPGFTSFPAIHWLGIALMICGTAFFVAAMIIMRNNWRAGFSDNQNTKNTYDRMMEIKNKYKGDRIVTIQTIAKRGFGKIQNFALHVKPLLGGAL
jgi:hypothetical protein